MKNALLCTLVILGLSGCASSYNDQSGSFWNPFDDRTVSVRALNDNLIEIHAAGNARTSQARVADFVKLKAAEETLSRGLTHFVFVENQDLTTSSTSASTRSFVDYAGETQYNTSVNTNSYPYRVTTVLMMPADEAPDTAISAQIMYDQLAPLYKR